MKLHVVKPVVNGAVHSDSGVVDEHTTRIEELGLFMRNALVDETSTQLSHEATSTIERMTSLGVAPRDHVVQELLLRVSDIGQRLVNSCSREELCVLLDSLIWLRNDSEGVRLAPLMLSSVDNSIAATCDIVTAPSQPTPVCCLYTQLTEQVQAAMNSGATVNSSAEVLRPSVLVALASRRSNQQVARLLLTALHTTNTSGSLPLRCVQALDEMVSTRTCMPLEIVEEFQTSGDCQTALASCFAQLPSPQLRQLSVAISHAATVSLSPNVLGLWSALGTAMRRSAKPVECEQVSTATQLIPAAGEEEEEPAEIEEIEIEMDDGGDADTEDVDGASLAIKRTQSDAQHWASSMQRVMASTSLASVAFSQHVHDQMAQMAQSGSLVSETALRELTHHWDRLLQAMPLEMIPIAVAQLKSLASQPQSSDEWKVLADKTQRVSADMARAAELMSDRAVDFYDCSKLTAQSVARALDAKQKEVRKLGSVWAAKGHKEVEAACIAAAENGGRADSALRKAWKAFKQKLPSLSKVEIVRDFSQTISLVFTNLYTVALNTAPSKMGTLEKCVDKIQIIYRGVFNAIAADFTAMFLSRYSGGELPDVLFACFAFAIGLAGLCFVCLAVAVALGADPHWEPLATADEKAAKKQRRRHKRKIRLVTVVLTICLSVHLPASRLCVEILFGHTDTSSVRQRYEDQWVWPYLRWTATYLLPVYVLGLIFLLIVLINNNAPKVSAKITADTATRAWWTHLPLFCWKSKHLEIHDVDGRLVPFHNSVYSHFIDHSPTQLLCPYRSLYGSFEWRWRYYKVIQLVIKVLLTVSLIPVRDARVRAFLTLLWTSLSFFMAWSAPYIDDLDDYMEWFAKGTAAVTCGGGVFLAYQPLSNNWVAMSVAIVINVVNLFNAAFLGFFTVCGADGITAKYKDKMGRLTFSDTVRYAVDKPPEKVLPKWDVEKEICHRVWHQFWKKQLLELKQEEAIQRLARSVEEEEAEAVLEAKMKHHGEEHSDHATQRSHWVGQADECVAAMRAITRVALEGPDVWYVSTSVVDGQSSSGFGRLTVVPFPFHCLFQRDDGQNGETTRIVNDRDLETLCLTNFRCDVVRKRTLRQRLRTLSQWGGLIELPYERDEIWTQEDKTVPFHCRYTQGVVVVEPDQTIQGSAGFRLSIRYNDGTGEVAAGESTHLVSDFAGQVTGDSAMALLGLTPKFDECVPSTLSAVFAQPPVAEALATRLVQLQDKQRRVQRQETPAAAADRVLSRGFRHVVYNNPRISREALEKYLAREETNSRLRGFATTHHAALDLLYQRLDYVHSDPRVAFWYLFWHDVYQQNGADIKALGGYRRNLDPEEPTSICYEVMPREALRHWLDKRKLWGGRQLFRRPVRWSNSLFHDGLLDLLYKCMENQVANQKVETTRVTCFKWRSFNAQ